MGSLTLNVRVNSEDKKRFEKFCSSVGMNVSTAINMFIKTVINEQRIPFEISSESEFEKYAIEKLKEAEEEMKTNNKMYTLEEVFDDVYRIIEESK